MFEPGTIFASKYRLDCVLGQGGMGVVALAHHLQLDQPVAIKFLLEGMLHNSEVVQRFEREARASVRLKSEHVCQVYDVGELENGAPYMVMEYLEGTDLAKFLTQHGPPSPGQAVDLILQACEALAEAHSLGIVHRDIKPANFFLTSRADGSPLVKILDFGISKAPVAGDAGLTSTQTMLGTPGYMSPEQLRSSKQVDPRSDIWSLGVVLYELLSGHRPFRADTFSELCLKVAMDPVAALTIPLPRGLDQVVMHCLEKDPAQRFQNIAEFALALTPFAQSPAQAATSTERTRRILNVDPTPPQYRTGSPGPTLGPPSTLASTSGQVSGLATAPTAAPRSRSWLVATVAAVITAVFGLVIMVLAGGTDPNGTAAPGSTSPTTAPALQAQRPNGPVSTTPGTAARSNATTTAVDAGVIASSNNPSDDSSDPGEERKEIAAEQPSNSAVATNAPNAAADERSSNASSDKKSPRATSSRRSKRAQRRARRAAARQEAEQRKASEGGASVKRGKPPASPPPSSGDDPDDILNTRH
ncbi:MAG: protein kinase [Proteobacteria bacterium]|nr:protein kinase [Pseudomonadota bacterium]